MRTFPILYNLSQKQLYEKVLNDLKDGNKAIQPDLFTAYSSNLKKGVGSVFGDVSFDNPNFDMQSQLQANVSRFAAYKAYHATQQIERQQADNNGVARSEEEFKKYAKMELNKFNRFQVAEYNTAVARARTAKQWQDFNSDPVNNKLYPSLRWLPSRSADPREEHEKFYGLVLPKTHPFWIENQPGNLWNCKCDWEECDYPDFQGKIPPTVQARGLEGNPGETGEIFTDKATYISGAGENRRERNRVEILAEIVSEKETIKEAKKALEGKITECVINDTTHVVKFIPEGIDEYAQSMLGHKDYFWIKNEILKNFDSYIKLKDCVGKKLSDPSHNTRRETIKLKEKTDFFFYFKVKLPNNNNAFVHLGRYRETGEMYLYTITKNIPSNIEMP